MKWDKGKDRKTELRIGRRIKRKMIDLRKSNTKEERQEEK